LLGVIPSFLVIRLGLGVCTAPLYPSCGRMTANWFPLSQRARIWGPVAAGAGIGSATSPLLFSWMIARYGWRTSFWIAAAATAALAGVWLGYARDHPSEHPALRGKLMQATEPESAQSAGPTPWGRLLTNPSLLRLVSGYFTVNYFEYIFFFWIYYYFGEIRHLGERQTAIYTSMTFVAWTLMTPLGGWASDRLVERYGRKTGRRLVPLVCLPLSAAVIVVAINLTSPAAVAGLLALSFGLASSTDGPFWACAIDVGGKHVGSAGAILNTGGNLGGFFAPLITPFIAAYFGWSWGLYAGSLLLAGGALVWLGIDPTKSIQD
jgi:ACS family glucarate transporter-like MFS transporter